MLIRTPPILPVLFTRKLLIDSVKPLAVLIRHNRGEIGGKDMGVAKTAKRNKIQL